MSLKFDPKNLERKEKDGVLNLKYTDRGVYLAGTDIKKSVFQEVAKYNKEYSEAASVFAKDIALSELKKDKDIRAVKVDMPWSHNSNGKLVVSINREKTFKGINGSDDVTKSTLQLKVKESSLPGKTFIGKLEEELTSQLIK